MSERIVIIGPSWVGDMVMAQSLFMTLKRERPDAAIDVVAPAWTQPLLARMPEVSRAIGAPFERGRFGFAERRALGRVLRAGRYDQAIVLPNSWKSALAPWLAGIPKRTGWRGEMRLGLLNDMRRPDKAALPLMIDRFNALAFSAGDVRNAADFPAPHLHPALAVDPAQVAATLGRFGLEADGPVLALCPGAEFGPSKRWPPEKYARIASDMAERGWRTWLFGSKNDAEICAAVSGAMTGAARAGCSDLSGRTTLGEAIDLLSLAGAVVSNDSGMMHIAAALKRPLVAVYGSTSPAFTPPLSDAHRIVRLGLDCSPCFQRDCPLGHHNCMNMLEPALVRGALDELAGAR